MGTYLNPNNAAFRESLQSKIYVDKSELIACTNEVLNTNQKFMCVSRPRRFGKTMAADMLVSYYSKGCDSAELFHGLKIEKNTSFSEHLNKHNVIRIDVQRILKRNEGDLPAQIQAAVLRDLREEFPVCAGMDDAFDLQTVLDELYAKCGQGFIFVIDEWDCVFRLAQEQEKLQKSYLDFLSSLFKGAAYVDLVYMTGILPIKKYGEHSAINMFTEFSVTSPKNLSSYFGFTEDEVRQQCLKRNVDFSEMEKWYDGYLIGDMHIYNPKSVFDALVWNEFRSHWTGTETYEALKVYIERNFDGLREAVAVMLGGGRCRINTRRFQNDMYSFRSKDDVLTLLVHLGYLTYDAGSEEVFIPNREIEEEFLNAMDGVQWTGLMHALDRSMQLLESTWKLDGDAVAAAIEANHAETASVFSYHDENSLACAVLTAYYSAKAYYTNPISELPTGSGRADLVYLPKKNVDRPALVVELKWNKSADGAIRQIKDKKYTKWIESYTGDILLVGINYDRKTKKHSCIIERHRKDAGA